MSAPHTAIHELNGSWIWKGNIPSLHGLRAVSVFIVIFEHAFKQARISLSWLPVGGHTGVDIFFVISGFLITLLFLREVNNTGKISLRNFYIRRILRLFPAFYFFLAVMCFLAMAGVVPIPLRDFGIAAIYITNLLPISMWPRWELVHCWSLCVEEHFYIVWPLILALVGRRAAFVIAMSYVVATPFLRNFFAHHSQFVTWAFTPVRADAIACGCCLAIATTSLKWRPRLSLTPWQCNVTIAIASIALVVNSHVWLLPLPWNYLGSYTNSLAGTVDAIFIAALIWACISHSSGSIGKVLNSRPVLYIGTLSYSIYLWQQPFFVSDRFPNHHVLRFLSSVLCIFVIAMISYHCVEKRFLAYKGLFCSAEAPEPRGIDSVGDGHSETVLDATDSKREHRKVRAIPRV